MANNIFEQWDNAFNMGDIQKEIQEAAKGEHKEFEEVPHGQYEVSIEKMELTATKKTNKPMVSVWFNIVNGEFKNQKIFMNSVIDPTSEWRGMQVHNVNEFLRSLVQDCENVPVVEFINFAQYKDLIMDIHELVAESFEYGLKYGKNKKGFNTFEITDVFVLED